MNEDGSASPDGSARANGGDREFGHLIVERSGGIGGLLLVWDLDIDSSEHRSQIGPQMAELPWRDDSKSQAATGADRYVYVIESRFGLVRFGEAEMPGEWKSLIEWVREIAEPERRRPGAD